MHCPRRSDNPTILPLFQMRSDLAKRWVLKPFRRSVRCASGRAIRHFLAGGAYPLSARLCRSRFRAALFSSSLREDLPSPFQMIDMEPAVRRLIQAIRNHEQIGVWGDYDVDGTTGASVLVTFLRELGAEPIYYVPHRIEEGYGLNVDGLRRLKERGVDLLVTIDCGIANARKWRPRGNSIST